MMLITRAKHDGIDVLERAILEIRGSAFDVSKKWPLLKACRPIEPHRLRAIAKRDRSGTVFVALRANILCAIRAADKEYILSHELIRVTKIMRMQHAPWKLFKPRK